MTHKLKTLPCYFEAVLTGAKTFEVRKDDRQPKFKVGDTLSLHEFDSGRDPECPRHEYLLADGMCTCETSRFTGRNKKVKVTYITDYKQKPGYVVMAIKSR